MALREVVRRERIDGLKTLMGPSTERRCRRSSNSRLAASTSLQPAADG